MLKIENLTKYYKEIKGVENLSLEIKPGEIFGFIGPNGAGKSTTIKCILNLLKKDNGKIYIDNQEITNEDFSYKEQIGYLPSEVHLYEDFTVKEMLEYSASFYQKPLKEEIEHFLQLLHLDPNKKIDELSFGNLKKVGLTIALMHHPKLLILDEPTSGLDPLMQETFFEILKEEKKKGTTIFFSSHNLTEVKRICDRVGMIKDGNLILVEKVKELKNRNFVVVTIEGKDITKKELPLKEMTIRKMEKDKIEFLYKGDINLLINQLQKIKLDKLLMEELSLEETFFQYYEEEKHV